ncbi:phospholipid-transporting ATPase ABCA3-like isoform X4 [Dermacentor albipictus]|uniref:phospholipid-transporting ATPase ABCA3-like isoform X4 n=1 Tax=Dermacentor albipictus TaxID=60249 RepID=UPI0031FBAA44
MLGNVKTFLWRTLCVQSRGGRVMGLVLAVAIAGCCFISTTSKHKQPTPLSKDSGTINVSFAFMPPVVSHIVYAPKSDYNDKLMRAVANEITSRLKATKMQQEESNGGRKPSFARLEDDSGSADASVDHDAPTSEEHAPKGAVPVTTPELVALTDAEAVIKKCKELLNKAKSKDSKTKNNITVGMLCLTASCPASDSASIALKLYAPVHFTNEDSATKFPLGSFFAAAPSFDQSVVYQQIIEQEHLKLQGEKYKDAQMNYEVSTGAMPGWVFNGNEDPYEDPLSMAIFIAFCFFVLFEVARIKEENENGTSEHQCVMGLSDAEFFWGHFLTALVKGLVMSFVAITVMFLPLHDEHNYGDGLNVSLVTVSFVISLIGDCLFIILISWVFPKGWLPLILSGVLLPIAPVVITTSAAAIRLPKYFLLSRKSKLTSCVFPHTALYSVMRIICLARDYEGGASWSLVTRRVLDKDNVTIGELWGGTLICDVVMTFLAFYLSKVLPWSTNNRQSPIFCLLPNYWRDEPAVAAVETVNVKQDVNRFEKLQPGDKVIISTDNLTKVFGAKPVLNGLSLKVCASKITCLLGHNGAGKTTLMSILTGMQAPTSGAATVCGYDVASQRYQVHQRVSFCQQTDIFFEYMTCAENLYYFGSLKGGKPERLEESIRETLRLVALEDKASSLPKTLSGGMKRKLSIAMTLVSEPEVLILDEPTAGMDPETRRTVWDTLTNLAKDRTLLLSSHDMEEADAIADQIIVMASGGIVCNGSISFLKKACGVGYKLTFSKVKNAFKLHDAMHIVHKNIPAAVVDDEKQEEVSIALGTLDTKDFPAMFKALESSLEKLGIAGIGVTAASMKDVYLKINLDWAPGGKAREQAVGGLFLLGFASSGPMFICVGYLAAELTATTSCAVLCIIMVFCTGPMISLMLKPLIYQTMSAVPHYVALIIPPYTVHSMFFKIGTNAEEMKQCKVLEKDRGTELGYSLGIDCTGGLLQFSYNGIGFELVAIVAEGLLLMALMIFLMSGYFFSGHALASEELPGEKDVEEEKTRVKTARQQDELAGYSLLAWNLHKRFGTLHAVRGIYMALRPSECFGLLGVNGAGKTTTFQMLAGLISVSDGDAVTAVAKLSGNIRQWQSQISYCFQLGGLLDNMNAYEYLYLVGRLRGIPENELKPMVDSIVSVVDLTEHASKQCGEYSGGNRRKLTIAAALLGVQPFVFLDEPYAGVDVVSRNKIFRAVAEMKKCSRTTFILTSHNMEECEFSCDRLTIMVNGQMMCLGTLQHLREKFGQGYRVEFFLEPTVAVDEVKLKKAVHKLFPGIQLKDTQKNLLSYHLMERIPWSELFTKVAHLQKKFPLEHALVGENTLQDIFLNFAKAQGSLPVPGFAAVVDVGTPSSTKSPAALSSPTAAAT